MNRIPLYRSAVCVAWLALVGLCSSIPALGQSGVSPSGHWYTEGTQILDPSGKPSMMRGIGLGGWLHPEPYMLGVPFARRTDFYEAVEDILGAEEAEVFWDTYQDRYVGRKDVEALAAAGFDHIRLPIHHKIIYHEDTRTFREKGFERIDAFLAWCEELGIAVVLDLHTLPGAQSEDSGPSDSDGEARLWTEPDPYQDMTVEIWEELARRYKDHTNIIGYDLINEPVTPDEIADGAQALRDLYDRLVAAVRAIDPHHIVFIEGNYFATTFDKLTPPFDDNMVYAFHKYWNNPDQGSIQYLLDIRDTHQVPLWMGESGENSNPWYYAMVRLMEREGIPWNFWTHKKMGTITSPWSSPRPKAFDQLTRYWSGQGAPLTQTAARAALFEMAEHLDLDSATVIPGILPALFDPNFSSRQDPFKEHVIPGVINAVDYDLGGLGAAYQDADFWRTYGSGGGNSGYSYRNDGVDIEGSTDPSGFAYNVGWLAPLEWMEYTLTVTESGTYDIEIRVASPQSGGSLNVYFDGVKVGDIDVVSTGGWQSWRSAWIRDVPLQAGAQVMRLSVGRRGDFNLNRLTFTPATATDRDVSRLPEARFGIGGIYPSPSQGAVRIDVLGEGVTLQVFDSLGRRVQSMEVTDSVQLSGFVPGLYLVQATDASGRSEAAPFVVVR